MQASSTYSTIIYHYLRSVQMNSDSLMLNRCVSVCCTLMLVFVFVSVVCTCAAFILAYRTYGKPVKSRRVVSNTLSTSEPSLLDLPVIYKVSVLPLGPLRPHMETYMCWANP